MASEKYQAYLCSREWGLKREAVIERSRGRCERCKRNRGTAVHHKTYARIYNEPLTDLIHLCEECHSYIHGRGHDDPVRARRFINFGIERVSLVVRARAFYEASKCMLVNPSDEELREIEDEAWLEVFAEQDAMFPRWDFE